MSSKEGLLEQLLDFPAGHPYAKWTGIHWRLVEIADAGVAVPRARLDDPCAADALEIVECARGANGRFAGRSWASSRQRAAVDWGRGSENLLRNEFAAAVLAVAGR